MIFGFVSAHTSRALASTEPSGPPTAGATIEQAAKTVDHLVDAAAKVWKLVQDGRPVAHAEPLYLNPEIQGSSDHWEDQTGWVPHAVSGTPFELINAIGMERIDFHYRIMAVTGGQIRGRGQYIKSVIVEPDGQNGNLNYAGWGTHLTVTISKPDVSNGGTTDDPKEVLRFSVYIVAGALSDYSRTDHIRIEGDGKIVEEGSASPLAIP